MSDLPDDATLERLAAVLARLGEPAEVVPSEVLIALGGLGVPVTVDFRARETLGHPLVVWRPAPEPPPWWDGLSPREQEVAGLVADGLSNRAIAGRLGVSVGTVKDHVHSVLVKARLRSRSQVAAALAPTR